MTRETYGLVTGFVGLLALMGCAPARPFPGSAKPPTSTTSATTRTTEPAGACAIADRVYDAYTALTSTSPFTDSSNVSQLIDVDRDLAALRPVRALDRRLDDLVRLLEPHRRAIVSAVLQVAKTQAAAEEALAATTSCRGHDIAEVDDGAGTRTQRKVVSSAACEPAVRLWRAARRVNLTRGASCASVAGHLKELSLKGSEAGVRDRLVAALRAHAETLAAYDTTIAVGAAATPFHRALVDAYGQASDFLDGSHRACFAQTEKQERVIGNGRVEPRAATVSVRPVWGGALATLSHPVEFGSGFVVRWLATNGVVETRIVTNAHVMDGAFEAEVAPGFDGSGDTQKWKAVLVHQDPLDDVAVLRVVEPAGTPAPLLHGFELRLGGAIEQEPVTAAGFPGVGVRPSFQISKGTVSNASFTSGRRAHQSFVQHTAAIDPGNSGGPLLDASGRVIAMNTLKVRGRENVGLAIPAARIARVLARAERGHEFDGSAAAAVCNAGAAALAAPKAAPATGTSAFGLALFETARRSAGANVSVTEAVPADEEDNPTRSARAYGYRALRTRIESEGGVRPFELCTDFTTETGKFVATLRTRQGVKHRVTLAPEHGELRIVAFD